MIPTIHCVGTLDALIDRPPHPSPLCVDPTCAHSGTAGVATKLHTSMLTPWDVVIKGHSNGVAHLIQGPVLLPTAIALLCAERRFMATFLSPITSRRCVFFVVPRE